MQNEKHINACFVFIQFPSEPFIYPYPHHFPWY